MVRTLFLIVFYTGIITICFVFLPTLIMPSKVTLFGGRLMGIWSEICLKYMLSVKIDIRGKENILSNEKFFIACTHQSAFETFYLQVIYNNPIFILKKELTKIPIFGWYLKKIGSISIDRNKIKKNNLDFMDKVQENYNKDARPIIIFPQGTRSYIKDRLPFKKGVSRIYDQLKIKCQPVVINSGSVWPKKGKMGTDKKVIISMGCKVNSTPASSAN